MPERDSDGLRARLEELGARAREMEAEIVFLQRQRFQLEEERGRVVARLDALKSLTLRPDGLRQAQVELDALRLQLQRRGE